MTLAASLMRLAASRRFFLMALALSTVMTLATIMLLHKESTPGAISINTPQPIQPKKLIQSGLLTPKVLTKPASNVTSLYSGALSVRLLAQEALATHVFDIPSPGVYQIQIIFEMSGTKLEQPVRMQVLVNYLHRMELREIVAASAAANGWWTVGATALPQGNVRISIQRVDSNAGANLVLNGIRARFMGGGRFLGGEDCVSSESAPDVFYSSDVFKCAAEQPVASIDDSGKLQSQTCAQSDLVLLAPGRDSALVAVSSAEGAGKEALIVQCKERDPKTPATLLTRILKKQDAPPPLQAKGAQSPKISVIHVFMDSIARAVGIMKLPKTMSLLRDIRLSSDYKQWQLLDMRGYSVLGGGTNRNMPPMVAGSEGRDAPAWDAAGWLFNDYRNKGYITGFAADECVLDHNSMVRIMSQEWSGSGSKFKDSLKKELREKADGIAHHTLYNVICGVQE
jgi:hypothetical protein